MKSRIIVKCSCGKNWEADNTEEEAAKWWEILDIISPGLGLHLESKGERKTVEWAFRLMWSRHSLYQQEQESKRKHEATVIQETIIETAEDMAQIGQKQN